MGSLKPFRSQKRAKPSFFLQCREKLKFLLTVHENTKNIADKELKNYLKLKKIEANINKEEKQSIKSFKDELKFNSIRSSINICRGEKCNELKAISAQKLTEKIRVQKKISII